jgi:hypothetical protein
LEIYTLKQFTAVLVLYVCAGVATAQDVSYRKDIAPMWQAKCAACHGDHTSELADFQLDEKGFAAKSQGPRMDTYGRIIGFIGWPDPGAIMRRLDDGKSPLAGGQPGNMYINLGSTDQERTENLQLLKAWIGDGAWNLNRWEARGDVPAVSRQQLEKIRVPY